MATKSEIEKFLADQFPQAKLSVLDLGPKTATIKKQVGFENQRPGETLSGPTIFAVADAAIYVAVLGELGLANAVTSQLNLNFLKKPDSNKALIGKCELIKIGRRVITGQVQIFSEGSEELVAYATGTYAIPSHKKLI